MADRGLCTREEIPAEVKWAIEDLYKNDDEWEADFTRLKEHLPELSAYEGRLGESAQTLLSMQRLCDKMNMLAEKVYVYANQRLHENTDNAVYQNLASRAQSLLVEMSERTSYIEPEIMGLPEGTIEKYLQENGELRVYGQYFENMIRQKAHVLPGEMEKLLASAGELAESPKDIFSMFNNADIRFPKITGEDDTDVEVTHGRFISLLQSKDQRVRKDAFEALYGVYEKFRNTLAATYRANVKQEVFFARARRYGSDLEAALDGSHIPVSVYDNLIHVVHEHLPLMHRYVKIRKKLLGLDELHMYDLYTPMTENSGEHFSFEDAKKTVLEGLAPMGEEYLSHLKDGFEHGWIDVYENQGKRSGAYSWGAYGTHPYVLLNYQGTLNDVFTLAHEMGHALHSWYSDETQPYIYAGYRIFVAEVASTCNEALLIHHLLKKAKDPKNKAYLINYFLEQFRTTLYRQTMFAEFEKITHGLQEAGEALTAERLCSIYYDLNKAYFGEDICIDRQIEMEWARIPHFYTPFYVYQYATGFSAAIALSGKILREGEAAVEQYKKFLKGGSSMYPLELLRLAGVDMEQKKPVEDALQVFSEYLDEMERLA
ncbi:oligoendopeptidase F [Clostridiaceae bacterium AF42-6]|jgi:oligoendopeptidase F|nr:oligoendopeptidase F [Clostridiales bacterium AM23-16LB]RHO84894.1 oligoendopeptidase F [Clostridiaceae bacterium AF42-6]RHP53078.1 oligoendopeptidase F [Clostridiaceae bacterium AF31-3BH]RHQ27160.1 oligoendopeptidase F [Clostridiaceae bacterium AF29-16BH]RHR46830.1 oligoendopeptidase F [Clostridiaceae bacterium AF18-31LB]